MHMDKILLVEDEDDLRSALCTLLADAGYLVLPAANGMEALELLSKEPSLVILDIMLPDLSGLEVCRRIRQDCCCNVPVLFLTALDSFSDKEKGFLAGGDDYLTKPFDSGELLLRTASLLRRYCIYLSEPERSNENWLIAGDLRVSEQFNEVFRRDERIELPDIEYRMLKLFMKHRRKIFSIRNLYETIWNEPFDHSCSNTVMVHIRKLRLKIEDNPSDPRYIRTEWGRGYCFYM
ncbi:MAG: response regulator transcription factor [Lachnospiraceae bacterium]|nr:response regulator transcription factor [Lachnospiraceae bacterium]